MYVWKITVAIALPVCIIHCSPPSSAAAAVLLAHRALLGDERRRRYQCADNGLIDWLQ